MSMVLCKLCGAFVDSDDFPDGFYTLKYPDDYVCDTCREENDLRTQFDEDLDKNVLRGGFQP